jgi:hypothetical protein
MEVAEEPGGRCIGARSTNRATSLQPQRGVKATARKSAATMAKGHTHAIGRNIVTGSAREGRQSHLASGLSDVGPMAQ